MLKIYELILLPWSILAIIIFFVLFRINAPYGKFHTNKKIISLPYKLGWFIQEIISPFSLFLCFYLTNDNKFSLSYFFIILWLIHYIYRSIFFPLRIKKNSSRIPVMIVISAVFFNSINGFINGLYFGIHSYDLEYLYNINFILGIFLFFTGAIINVLADNVLIKIKSQHSGYKIPNGNLYKYISCPNYLGEIIEWFGFYVMTLSTPALIFFIWTVANLFPRAIATHKWYKNKFENYPKHRKAILPFIL